MNLKKSVLIFFIFPLAALVFVCGCHKQEQKPPASPATAASSRTAIVSAEKTSFDEVTSKLDPGGNLYLYLSTEQVMSGLSAKLVSASNFVASLPNITGQRDNIDRGFDFLTLCVRDSGIEQISGLGMSSIAREPGFYYGKLVVHHYPGQDAGLVWSLFGKEPHRLQELDLLPEETVLAMFSDVDVPLLWKTFQKDVEQLNLPAAADALKVWPDKFKQLTRLDFEKTLESLGGNYGMILTLDQEKKINLPLPTGAVEIPSPGLAIIAKVKSDLIFDRIDALGKGNPLVVSVDSADLKMRTVTIPLPLPIDLRPSIARSGDYLLLATSDTLIREILDVKSGKTKGFKTTPEFARLSRGIPEDGNNFTLVAARFIKSMAEIQSQSLSNKANLTPEQIASLQNVFNRSTNGGNYSVGVNGPEGWEGFANGSQSAQSMLLPMAAAGAGLAAAVAIPNFVRARATAQKNTCINNLRRIDAAKQQWALLNKKESNDTPTADDLKPYLGKLPKCPSGGDYTIGSMGEKPTCAVAGHELP